MKKLLFLLLLATSSYAFSPNDLNGGNIVAQGICGNATKQYMCVLVEKDGTYLAMFDKMGLKYIYRVHGIKAAYAESEMDLLWQRYDT